MAHCSDLGCQQRFHVTSPPCLRASLLTHDRARQEKGNIFSDAMTRENNLDYNPYVPYAILAKPS